MSTILKALRRLEDEKAAQTRASLEEEVLSGSASEPTGKRRARVVIAAALAVGATAAFVLAALWSPRSGEPNPTPGPAAAEPFAARPASRPGAPEAPPSPTPARRAIAPVAVPPPAYGAPPPIARESGQRELRPIAPSRRAAPVPRPPSAPRPQPKRVAVLRTGTEPAPAEPPARREPPLASAREPIQEAPPPAPPEAEPQAPRVANSEPARAPQPATPPVPGAPEVKVLRTVWHPKAERRTAELALGPGDERRVLQEGERIGSLVLLEISPSGVLFEQDGQKLRRRVGQ